MNTSCSGQGSTDGPEVYEDRDRRLKIVHVENVVTVVCSPPPPLAHKKYESVAAINFLCHIVWPVGLFFIA